MQAELESKEDDEIEKVLSGWQGFYGGFEPLQRQYKRLHEDEEVVDRKEGAEGVPVADAVAAQSNSTQSRVASAAPPLSLAEYWKQKRLQDAGTSATATSPVVEEQPKSVKAPAVSSDSRPSSSAGSRAEPTFNHATSAPLARSRPTSSQTTTAAIPYDKKRRDYYNKVMEKERSRQEEARRQAKDRSSSSSIFSKLRPEAPQETKPDSSSAYLSGLSGLTNWFRGSGRDESSANKH
jgi:hypothetical protein